MKHKPPLPLRGFTLIELLSVIAIIAILAGILIPAVSAARHQSSSTKSISNLRQIGIAAMTHANENKGRFPSAYWKASDGWMKTLYERIYQEPFVDNGANGAGLEDTVFWSPVVESTPATQRFCYGMNDYFRTFSGQKPLKNGDDVPQDGPLNLAILHPARTCFIAETKGGVVCKSSAGTAQIDFRNAGDTAGVLFFDGHVESLTDEQVPDNWQGDGRMFWMGGPVARPKI
ncbi:MULTISPECIES: type II secretion system protein [unclassified Lentimonas]|uniref:type II secretion system protein n=1 Tax=unclassified Lentimonas TaxID=2630993 RepID=UPI001327D075|nr:MULTISPECIES: prepilin-type N-terminal cleavage/methylation domain-containing protein [unclassified Lentimonas]CAA6679676.1 Unannotated [Lentimonas sp. CC4]CAA6683557.1 Unannotated [Lentimonas sp. CC6]CAA6690736.1 Unannotated [Lentimonas sp. CC19]CAA6693328.1 Unannotated [Lentimonas sp. CC10]CAA7071808.1 Unannotated [Lentimonas sp. CC11]